MLSLEKAKKIMERLANTENLTIMVDQASSLRIRKRRNAVKVEGLVETDKEHLVETIRFYLPHLKIK